MIYESSKILDQDKAEWLPSKVCFISAHKLLSPMLYIKYGKKKSKKNEFCMARGWRSRQNYKQNI